MSILDAINDLDLESAKIVDTRPSPEATNEGTKELRYEVDFMAELEELEGFDTKEFESLRVLMNVHSSLEGIETKMNQDENADERSDLYVLSINSVLATVELGAISLDTESKGKSLKDKAKSNLRAVKKWISEMVSKLWASIKKGLKKFWNVVTGAEKKVDKNLSEGQYAESVVRKRTELENVLDEAIKQTKEAADELAKTWEKKTEKADNPSKVKGSREHDVRKDIKFSYEKTKKPDAGSEDKSPVVTTEEIDFGTTIHADAVFLAEINEFRVYEKSAAWMALIESMVSDNYGINYTSASALTEGLGKKVTNALNAVYPDAYRFENGVYRFLSNSAEFAYNDLTGNFTFTQPQKIKIKKGLVDEKSIKAALARSKSLSSDIEKLVDTVDKSVEAIEKGTYAVTFNKETSDAEKAMALGKVSNAFLSSFSSAGRALVQYKSWYTKELLALSEKYKTDFENFEKMMRSNGALEF